MLPGFADAERQPAASVGRHMRITFCKPAEQDVFFDAHQFDGRRAKAVSAATEIAFSDFGRMHVERRAEQRSKRFIPAYATDLENIRKVLAVAAWGAVHPQRPLPDLVEHNADELMRVTDLHVAKIAAKAISAKASVGQKVGRQRFVSTYAEEGAWLTTRAAVAYRSWRLGENSCQIAAQLSMSPQQVRAILGRLNAIARKLGYETFAPIPEGSRRKRSKMPPAPKLLRLVKRLGLRKAARRIGLSPRTVQKKFYAARRSYKSKLTS
jgi:hypothetical protein